ncbi:MAG: hypothetical protein ABI300_03445 [Rhodanobacter sp.]
MIIFLCCLGSPTVLAQTPATTPASTPAATIPISNFIRPADISRVRISPDGKYLSAIVPKPNSPHENLLAILDGQTAKVINVIPPARMR